MNFGVTTFIAGFTLYENSTYANFPGHRFCIRLGLTVCTKSQSDSLIHYSKNIYDSDYIIS